MADLKARGIYTIARIVTFKDNILATARPDLAIIDTRTGKPWIDNEKLAWVDPFREEVWAYNIAIAQEAVRRGFDEIQFDYVRFPTDGKLGAARYAKPNSKETRLPAIAGFLAKARARDRARRRLRGRRRVRLHGVQRERHRHRPADRGAGAPPRLHLPDGLSLRLPEGHPRPLATRSSYPYKVVHESVRLIRKRAGGTVARVRPWLQDFKDYAFDRRIFGVSEVQAQIRGLGRRRAARAGCSGTRATTTPGCRRCRARRRGSAGDRRDEPRRCVRGASSLCSTAALILASFAGAELPAPNELGRVMILEYHKIDYPEERWTRTPENFRRDLETLYARGLPPAEPQRR